MDYAFLYSSQFNEVGSGYGDDHPFKVGRYRLTYELVDGLGLLKVPSVGVVESQPSPEAALLGFHRADYLDTLRRFSQDDRPRADFFYGLGDHENPVFKGLYDWSLLACGGTLQAARLVAEQGCRIAFNMAGGWHHAQPARASGFSFLNDAVVAINYLLAKGLRVAYVDLDAHHGDAVQQAFYATDRVLTISLHEWGKDFYPQTGSVHELGQGRGYGFSINVPFHPHADDLIFEQALRQVVLPLLTAFQPDVLVTQFGVDALRTDPLTRLELTTGAFELAARAFRQTGLPWVAVGGGGYDTRNVARTWALVWGIMVGAELPDFLPPGLAAGGGEIGRDLRDRPRLSHPDDFSRAQAGFDKVLRILRQKVFPLHGLEESQP